MGTYPGAYDAYLCLSAVFYALTKNVLSQYASRTVTPHKVHIYRTFNLSYTALDKPPTWLHQNVLAITEQCREVSLY